MNSVISLYIFLAHNFTLIMVDDDAELRFEGSNNHDNVNSLESNNDSNQKSFEMQPLTNGNGSNGDDAAHSVDSTTSKCASKCGVIELENDLDNAIGMVYIERPWNFQDWLYPPQLPPELQLLRKENIAIPLCYLLVGVLQGLSGPLINVYPLDLNATEAQQTTISTLKSLPASLKLIFGFLSDNFPILGYRRKTYMLIGWGLSALSYGSLLFTTDLTLSEVSYEKSDGSFGIRTDPPINAPSIPFLSLMTFLYGAGE